MRELKSWRWIFAKGLLFLLLGLVCAGLLVAEYRSLRAAALLAVTIWCFCRFYYFAFYVIERYVDPDYRFSGLGSFARYVFQRRR
jgi:hypothetical protein